MEHYGIAPDVLISGDGGLTIPYIPAHLDYMLCALGRAALRLLCAPWHARGTLGCSLLRCASVS